MWQAITFVVVFAVLYLVLAVIEGPHQSATGEPVNYLRLALWPAILSGVFTLLITGFVSIVQ